MQQSPDLAWLRSRLLRWFGRHGRSYPWRDADDPYHVLVAELMLRRTKASQVAPAYAIFLRRYPNARSLAEGEEHELQSLTRSLGLRGRTTQIHAMAAGLRDLYAYRVPSSRAELKRLAGVGDYVAGAVLSFAYGKPEWIVDTNVVRVFRRFFGLRIFNEGRRSALVISLAREYSRSRAPRKANLALIDHAALVCRARMPLCSDCPANNRCRYYSSEPVNGGEQNPSR